MPGASYSYTRVVDFFGIDGMLDIFIYDSPLFVLLYWTSFFLAYYNNPL